MDCRRDERISNTQVITVLAILKFTRKSTMTRIATTTLATGPHAATTYTKTANPLTTTAGTTITTS